ncbi:type I glyceraldehyde-3-phosphate dehydrogenase [Isachenkonia alkalipeptolytica]|uniref:Glyceraldehyde-3-phosphate dehydrogenase n=2 Tax=Isachenkonia alkalipeptolytica TaxID=2565777 RepID=A0AA43XM31_9CLOT|nr:type I glyceraldehyde-3-phosphate dehydrogenase [Isachenkonia alkalipeptolytica]
MMKKVAINGFGRIGRNVLKSYLEKKLNWEIVAINDLTDAKTLGHLLRYDSIYGKLTEDLEVREDALIIAGKEVKIFSEKDPANLPWAELGVDLVIESTGIFRSKEEANRHIEAGARKVLITAPAKNEDITIVMGVNEKDYDPQKHNVLSNASCTTNCLAPFAKLLDEHFSIKRGIMTTIHSYTNDQNILDLPHKDLRRARAAAQSIIPTTTGAAEAVSLVLPQLKGKLTGMAMRVPTPTVSVVDLVVEVEKNTDVEAVNEVFKNAANNELKGILDYSEEPLVSADYIKNEFSTIIDGLSTDVMQDNMIKVIAWYDNEWGYSVRVVDLVDYMFSKE